MNERFNVRYVNEEKASALTTQLRSNSADVAVKAEASTYNIVKNFEKSLPALKINAKYGKINPQSGKSSNRVNRGSDRGFHFCETEV